MKIFKSVTLLLILFSLTQCDMSNHAARSHSSCIVEQCRLVIAYEDSLMEVITKNELDRIDIQYVRMMSQISSSIDSINSLSAFEEDLSLNKSSLNLLNTYLEIGKTAYPEIIKLSKIPDNEYTQTDDKIIQEVSERINIKLQSELDSFIVVQKAFAKFHGLTF